MKFILQPNIYESSNSPHDSTLLSLLEKIWIKDIDDNDFIGLGTYYVLSGFSNFNGGIRFYNRIFEHIQKGGHCRFILGGSTRQKMSSKQIVRKLLEIGCEVYVINRKAIFHAKCYGYKNKQYQNLVVSSGNFTSRGISQNIEAAISFDNPDMTFGFDWGDLWSRLKRQKIEIYKMDADETQPGWKLLFDEENLRPEDSDIDEVNTSMVITLSHSDTARIQANKGERAGLGTQYFWLSKDSFDFFPPLDDRNTRGVKSTYQTEVNMHYIDLNINVKERVTFEAQNNYDFRLGTSGIRYTQIASVNDLAVITRLSERNYEMRIFKPGTEEYNKLIPYAVNSIGNKNKKYGYLPNERLHHLLGF